MGRSQGMGAQYGQVRGGAPNMFSHVKRGKRESGEIVILLSPMNLVHLKPSQDVLKKYQNKIYKILNHYDLQQLLLNI